MVHITSSKVDLFLKKQQKNKDIFGISWDLFFFPSLEVEFRLEVKME